MSNKTRENVINYWKAKLVNSSTFTHTKSVTGVNTSGTQKNVRLSLAKDVYASLTDETISTLAAVVIP